MRQKSMNDLMRQVVRVYENHSKGRMRAYFAYYRAFKAHFGFYPHSDACIEFVNEYGLNYKA